MSHDDAEFGRELGAVLDAALKAADAGAAVRPHLPPRPKGRLLVVGAGKAAGAMAAAVEAAWDGPLEGVLVVQRPSSRPFSDADLALVGALAMIYRGREGWAFALLGVTIATFVLALFVALYPNVMPATDPANTLTAAAAASSPYTLKVMTIVAVVMAPVVIAYQAWTYWVFRKRIGRRHIPRSAVSVASDEGVKTPAG